MAEHGYAREYDEPIDRGTDDRERWRSEDRQRDWRGSGGERDSRDQRDRNERNVNFMLGDRDRSWDRDDRYGDRQARSAFGNDDRQYRMTHAGGWDQRDRGMGQHERKERNFGSQQDDHYISWRNRQLEALDRDYDDYCREREQQFHRDFDSWRQNRTGAQQEGQGQSSEEVMELNNPTNLSTEPDSGPSPVGDATLGTNNDENTARGRR